MTRLRFYPLVSILALVFATCAHDDAKKETYTRGALTVVTSEDIFPTMDHQVSEFERFYTEARLEHGKASAREAVVWLLNDSIRVISTARDFNLEEKRIISEHHLTVDSQKVALDGVAVIVHPENALTRIHVNALRDLLAGQLSDWSVLVPGTSGTIPVLVDDPNGGVHEYLRSRLLKEAPIEARDRHYLRAEEIVEEVSRRKDAIGFVGASWLMKENRVRALEVGDPLFYRDTSDTELEYFPPHQAHIYRGYYPLIRTVRMYYRNLGGGVGNGFITFVATTHGQQLFVKDGLVPATLPVRLVELKSEPLQ